MQLRDDRERFDQAGAGVVLIALGPHTRAALFCDERHVPFRCLSDPGQDAYRAYGLERAAPLQVFNPRVYVRYARAVLKRDVDVAKASGDDWRQMPGTFVIDRQGMVRYTHRNRDVSDNPPNEAILESLAALPRPRRRS